MRLYWTRKKQQQQQTNKQTNKKKTRYFFMGTPVGALGRVVEMDPTYIYFLNGTSHLNENRQKLEGEKIFLFHK